MPKVKLGYPKLIAQNIVRLSVNQLRKLGRNRFHLIVSTWGGIVHSRSIKTSMANIYLVLKPGGKAFIGGGTMKKTEIIKSARKLGIRSETKKNGIVIYK